MELLLKITIHIDSKYLAENLNEYLKEKIIDKVSGTCVKEGLILPDSINIEKRSIGRYRGAQFNGQMEFDVIYKATVINPAIDEIIEAKVNNINKYGLMATAPYMRILVPHQYNPKPEIVEKYKADDDIKIRVKGKKFKLNDTEIIVLGSIHED